VITCLVGEPPKAARQDRQGRSIGMLCPCLTRSLCQKFLATIDTTTGGYVGGVVGLQIQENTSIRRLISLDPSVQDPMLAMRLLCEGWTGGCGKSRGRSRMS
jgi:hypothetical protein